MKINDLYVFISSMDFSLWQIVKIKKNNDEIYNRVIVEKIFPIEKDEIEGSTTMEFGVYLGDDIKHLEKVITSNRKNKIIELVFCKG